MKHWTPETEGAGFDITRLLDPIKAYRDQMTVMTGLNGVRSNAGGARQRRDAVPDRCDAGPH